MKKSVVCMLAFCMIVSVSGCGKDESVSKKESSIMKETVVERVYRLQNRLA